MTPKFKVLVDEMSAGLIPYLQALGWTVTPSVPKGETDCKVLEIAQQRKAVIITKDHGLVKRCHKAGVPCVDIEYPIIKEATMVHQKLMDMKNLMAYYASDETKAEEEKK